MLQPIVKEHRDYGVTVDKVMELGNAYDSLVRPESPSRRRSSVSPVKRTSVTASPSEHTIVSLLFSNGY